MKKVIAYCKKDCSAYEKGTIHDLKLYEEDGIIICYGDRKHYWNGNVATDPTYYDGEERFNQYWMVGNTRWKKCWMKILQYIHRVLISKNDLE